MKRYKENVLIAIVTILCASFGEEIRAEENKGAMLWPFDVTPGYVSGMSDNGKWGVYKYPDYDEVDAVPRRMNLVAGKVEELPLLDLMQQRDGLCKCTDITDDGGMIVGSYNDMPAYYKDGKWHTLPMPSGLRGFYGPVSSVTPDGSWMTAWVTESFTKFAPIIWHNFEVVEIGELPGYQELYDRGIINRQTLREHEQNNQTPNFAFFKISADGKHILSGIDHNYPGWGCSYIVYHTDTRTYDWIADEIIEKGAYVSYAQMSDNGKWIGASITSSRTNPDGSWDDYSRGVLYDVENKTFAQGQGWGQLGNDGNFYNLRISDGEVEIGIDKILKEKYGIDFYKTTGYDQLGTAFYISSDLKTMLCQPYYRNQAYSFTFPVEFKEAAKGINLLTEAEFIPRSGSDLSKMRKVTLKFEYASRYVEGTDISLLRGEEEIAKAAGVTKRGREYDILFDDVVLRAGESYSVKIPEGAFVDESGKGRSVEFRVDYNGREDKALAPVSISPRSGSKIMELSINNYVTLDFATDIVLESDKYAELSEAETQTPVCKVQIATDGRHLALYPAAARKLPLGKKYRLTVPRSVVTDLNGENGNEEISIDYEGTFAPSAGAVSSNQLFFDDFTSPNESLNHFLQYEGDHLTPSQEMQEWGFDSDNTPWNFSVRDEEDYNYCACSTSLYEPKGKSDNWLVIPRLTIENEYEWLTFKSQCYYYNTYDKLKVIVWESDELFGSLDKEIVTRMRTEGDVVYDEAQSCGRSVDRLEGDWRENEISLAAYKGKNIYIAFVDENENASALFLDDICVVYRGNYELQIELPGVTVGDSKCDVKGLVKVGADKSYNTIEATVKVNSRPTDLRHYATGVKIERGHDYAFGFEKQLELESGRVNRVELTVRLDDEVQTVARDVKALDFKIDKNVLVEEGTGTWCGWCPQGIIALEYLQNEYPGRVAEVSVHFNDALTMSPYSSFLNFGAYPAGRVDRTDAELAPMIGDPITGRYSLTSAEGDKTFVDIVEQRLATPAEAEIKIVKAAYNDVDDIVVDVEVRYAMNNAELHYNLLGIVTEYGVMALQQNNLAGATDPLVGEWGEAGSSVYAAMPAVARGISCNSFYGEPGVLPERTDAGMVYKHRIKTGVPETVENRNQMRFVVAIIDATNSEVVNCAMSDFLTLTGVDSRQQERWEVKDGCIMYAGEVAEVYTLSGLRIPNTSLHGVYIAKAIDSEGNPHIKKITL